MKKYVLQTYLFFTLIMSIIQVKGQESVFSFSPENYVYSTDSFSIFNTEFMIEGILHSNVKDTLEIIWRIEGIDNCPSGWAFKLNDSEFGYQLSSTVNSNYLPQTSWVSPIKLYEGHSTASFLLFLYPEEIPGCCHLNVSFSLLDSVDSIEASANYFCAMIDANCLVSKVNENSKDSNNITIVPNPASEILRILSDFRLSNIQIWNIAGLKLIEQTGTIQELNITYLPNGMYLVRIESEAGAIEWKKVIIKH